MPFNVLLLPLLGGYIFITNWNRTRFDAKRHTGERLLFEAATAGLLFLLVAFVLVHLVTAADPALHDRWAREVPFPYAGTSLLAFLLGAVAWFPANWFFRRDREARRVIQEWGDHLEVLFDRAIFGRAALDFYASLSFRLPPSRSANCSGVWMGRYTRRRGGRLNRRPSLLHPALPGLPSVALPASRPAASAS
jgi:hypothetical protein